MRDKKIKRKKRKERERHTQTHRHTRTQNERETETETERWIENNRFGLNQLMPPGREVELNSSIPFPACLKELFDKSLNGALTEILLNERHEQI